MFKSARMMFLTTLTPTHVGSGSEVSIIDLPIQRESHTTFPKIEGSSLKGCIRDAVERGSAANWEHEGVPAAKMMQFVFGPEDEGQGKFASAITFSDARLLFFPVKSARGVFAWITCPLVLQRFLNDLKMIGIDMHAKLPEVHTVTKDSKLFIRDKSTIMLEEFIFQDMHEDTDTTAFIKELSGYIPENELITHRFETHVAVLPDDDFKNFVNLSTEAITRIKINPQTGVVEKGALFNEEYLPTDTIMYSLILVSTLFTDDMNRQYEEQLEEKDIVAFIENSISPPSLPAPIIQIGGNRTLGKGLIAIKITSAKTAEKGAQES